MSSTFRSVMLHLHFAVMYGFSWGDPAAYSFFAVMSIGPKGRIMWWSSHVGIERFVRWSILIVLFGLGLGVESMLDGFVSFMEDIMNWYERIGIKKRKTDLHRAGQRGRLHEVNGSSLRFCARPLRRSTVAVGKREAGRRK